MCKRSAVLITSSLIFLVILSACNGGRSTATQATAPTNTIATTLPVETKEPTIVPTKTASAVGPNETIGASPPSQTSTASTQEALSTVPKLHYPVTRVKNGTPL